MQSLWQLVMGVFRFNIFIAFRYVTIVKSPLARVRKGAGECSMQKKEKQLFPSFFPQFENVPFY
jgi:hypothetical protein